MWLDTRASLEMGPFGSLFRWKLYSRPFVTYVTLQLKIEYKIIIIYWNSIFVSAPAWIGLAMVNFCLLLFTLAEERIGSFWRKFWKINPLNLVKISLFLRSLFCSNSPAMSSSVSRLTHNFSFIPWVFLSTYYVLAFVLGH